MTAPALQIDKLSYRYPDGTQALHEISMTIQPGERVAVMGPNGAGKSTLFFHLNGTFRGDGEIRIENELLTKDSVFKIRQRVGLVFQDPNDQLFMPTVFEDVAFGPINLGCNESETRTRVIEALEIVGMQHSEGQAPHHLSLGQRKKVAIAAVLALKPTLLAFDEPSSGLDPRSRRHLIEFLQTLPQTQLVATHDLDLVLDLCQRAIIIDEGRIVFDGKVPEVFDQVELLQRHGLEQPLSRRGGHVKS